MSSLVYPFAAIVGQDKVKRGLLIASVNPAVGGALLCGQKGTAKSTIVRGLAHLARKRVVELPLNVTEDRLIGAIDFEHAIRTGERRFSGGVLEKADGQILYVDEINLLPEGITDALIFCASGENVVEREGISVRHDCRFTLIGTMNPEEGSLRPQLLDKLGLYMQVEGESDVAMRAEIVRRRLEYERDPLGFIGRHEAESKALSDRIREASRRLPGILVSPAILQLACQYASHANVQGNRTELLLIETAKAIAALDARDDVSVADIKEAAGYVLPHRRREVSEIPEVAEPDDPDESREDESQKPDEPDQLLGPDDPDEEADDAPQDSDDPAGPPEDEEANHREELEEEQERGDDEGRPNEAHEGAADDDLDRAETVYEAVALPSFSMDRMARKGSGRRSKTKSGANRGRYSAFTASPRPGCRDIALDATIRAAAPYQTRRPHNGCAVSLENGDFRYKVRESHVGATIIFLVDASGSMGAAHRMKETKEAILSLLMDSYRKRDKVGLIAFGRGGARTLLDVTSSIDLAKKRLQDLPTGGKTPLAAGLFHAWQFIRARRVKDPEMVPMLLLVTDGRANEGLWTQSPVDDAVKAASLLAAEKVATVIIDTEKSFVTLGLAKKVAKAANAVYWKVDEIRGKELGGVARTVADNLQDGASERRRTG